MCAKDKNVNKGLVVRIYPDEDMKRKIDQNIDNVRFTWNQLLDEYENTYKLFKQNGYTKLMCNWKTFNSMLMMLKKRHSFLYDSESSSLQQAYNDLINAFKRFFNNISGYPKHKSKKNHKQACRIQNNDNIKINDNTIVLPKLGEVYYRTSPFYKQQLKESKINNVTVKREHDYYWMVFNTETPVDPFDKSFDSVGIDLGVRTLATLSNELKIANLDVTYEDKMIKKYYRILSRRKYNSNRYNKTLRTLGKWIQKKKNRLNDAYHKLSHYIVENYDVICMENLDIKEMFQDKDLSPKLQTIALSKLVEMIKYKCEWYGKTFIQIGRWFPSSKTCNECGYYYEDLGRNEKEWICPKCKAKLDRDINAAKNIEKEGLRILREEMMNLWCRGDSTVILLSLESNSP